MSRIESLLLSALLTLLVATVVRGLIPEGLTWFPRPHISISASL